MLKHVLVAFLMMTPAAMAAEQVRTLNLTGEGVVTRAPDMATISVGVNSAGKTARQALTINSEAAAAVIGTLQGAGIEDKDIQTSNFGIQPVYKSSKRISSSDDNPVDYYRVTNMVSATIRDLDGIGAVLDHVITAGGNQINGLRFGLTGRDAAMDEARRLAVADARRKAELYAEAAGITLGPILSISEAGGRMAPQNEMMVARASGGQVPVKGGELSVTATVSIVWEIGSK